jgi:hypothetical protein
MAIIGSPRVQPHHVQVVRRVGAALFQPTPLVRALAERIVRQRLNDVRKEMGFDINL